MTTNSTKRLAGFALLLVSSVIILAGGVTEVLPIVAGSVAALGLAAGALLVGTSGEGRPV
ncbi:hypothetical protein [Halorhabdus amylolytica]|uniref:hypothetical protein n=1 Tax=Halorhabdus amylolytica TaxID=2559573 RepID=UPI0010AAD63C|nr:hypothetical protein [Halorhabdus amylolytica]